MKLLQLVVTAFSIFATHSILLADEIWTYRFVVDGSLPYDCSCDLMAYRADISGTFSILLDWQNLNGRLVELNDQLVNLHEVRWSPTGSTLVPMNPSEADWRIASGWDLAAAEGPFVYTNGQWQVTSDHFGLPYNIRFDWNQAIFNMTLPIMDAYATITNARATFVSAVIAGDHNYDGIVDGADYVVWQKLNLSNYQNWRESFSSTASGGGGGATAPEPGAIVLVMICVGACKWRRGVRRQ